MIETILPAAWTLSILLIAFPLWFSVISVDSVLKEGHGSPLRLGLGCGFALWVFRDPDLPAHELPIRFMGARREKIRGSLCRKLCRKLCRWVGLREGFLEHIMTPHPGSTAVELRRSPGIVLVLVLVLEIRVNRLRGRGRERGRMTSARFIQWPPTPALSPSGCLESERSGASGCGEGAW